MEGPRNLRILRHKLRQLRRLSSADRRLLIRIALLVPLIEAGLRLGGFKAVLARLQKFAVAKQTAVNPMAEVERHTRLLFLFHRQLPFAGRCLARSLTLWYLLQREGIETEVRFGVRKHEGQLSSHAWIEYQARVLEPIAPQQFRPFSGSILQRTIRTS